MVTQIEYKTQDQKPQQRDFGLIILSSGALGIGGKDQNIVLVEPFDALGDGR